MADAMPYAGQFHMPGAYHFESSNSASALNAGIFRPPISPSASSYNLAKSTGSLLSDTSVKGTPAPAFRRKRTRDDVHAEGQDYMEAEGDLASPMVESANGRHQSRYILAGHIETPGARFDADPMEESVYSDIDYRRALGPKNAPGDLESPSVQLAKLRLGPETPAPRGTSNSAGWSTFALHTIGGVVGKVWEFCRGGAFTGFYAGGGKGYNLDGTAAASPAPGRTERPWRDEYDVPSVQTEQPSPNMLNTPGRFPEAEHMPFTAESHELSTPEITTRPAAKRRQLSENDELRRNWVMVDEPSSQPTRSVTRPSMASAASSRPPRAGLRQQQAPRYSMPTTSSGRRINVPVSRISERPSMRRTSVRISHAGSPSLSAREPASFAQPRSRPSTPSAISPTKIPLPSTIGGQTPNPFARTASPRPSSRQSSTPNLSHPPFLKSATTGHRRTASGASIASTTRQKTDLDTDTVDASPRLDAEARHLAAKRLAAERDADARIEEFNARLRDMIRQGKEALGTRVEVEMDEDGWDED